MYDVLIVGSGVIGMSIARALSYKSNSSIAVVDRDVPGLHASYKAGGMLGAQNEFENYSPLYELAIHSRRYFKDLAEDLYNETNIDIEFVSHGLIKMASNINDIAHLNKQYTFLSQHDEHVKALDKSSLQSLSNGYIDFHNQAIYIPDDGQINASKYTKALLESITNKGVDRFYKTEVTNITKKRDYYNIETSHDVLQAKKVVIAGGAWSHELIHDSTVASQITGVKGEVLLLENKQVDLKQTLFMTNGCYIVPKAKNRFLVGATSYMNDFSVGTSKEGESWLFNEATQYVPALKLSNVIHKWSGVRPYTENEWPIMDEVDDGLFLVTGHYRNGILLSPIIGKLMSEWIINDHTPSILERFKAKRSVEL